MQRIRTNKFECTCKVCNKKFFAKTTLAEICSTECRNYNRTKHLTYKRKCIICGKDFETVSHNRVICGAEECQKKYGCLRTKKYNETHPKEHKNRVCKTQEENNLSRNHWLARFYSDRGIKVLPFVMWSTPDNFDWCFDGTSANSTVSITTNGTINDKEAHNYFLLGYEEMMKRLKPKKVVVFTVTEKTDQIGISGDHIQFVNCAVRKTLK